MDYLVVFTTRMSSAIRERTKIVAGKIQFDREKAVDAAVQVFWRKGFISTSMEDIKKATGINESSLYNTFRNKESLYKEALALYRKRIMDNFATYPNLERPAETLRNMFTHMARLAATEEGAAGCMLMNSAMELGAEHGDIAKFARDSYAMIEEWLYVTVKKGQELGEIPTDRDARKLAGYLSFNIQALFAVARTSPTEEFMNDVAESILTSIFSEHVPS